MNIHLPRQVRGTDRNIHRRRVALGACGLRVRPSFLPLLLSLL